METVIQSLYLAWICTTTIMSVLYVSCLNAKFKNLQEQNDQLYVSMSSSLNEKINSMQEKIDDMNTIECHNKKMIEELQKGVIDKLTSTMNVIECHNKKIEDTALRLNALIAISDDYWGENGPDDRLQILIQSPNYFRKEFV